MPLFPGDSLFEIQSTLDLFRWIQKVDEVEIVTQDGLNYHLKHWSSEECVYPSQE
jgi:hypothetical protein